MGDFILGLFLGASVIFVMMMVGFDDFNKIYSNERIEPSFTVTIKGGKSDTLFIYKKD